MKKNFLFLIMMELSIVNAFSQKNTMFKNKHVNFGVLSTNTKKVVAIYTLYNNSNKSTIITEASGTCSCTLVKYPKKPIKKGQKAKIYIDINTKLLSGFFEKSAIIRFINTDPVVLRVNGYQTR